MRRRKLPLVLALTGLTALAVGLLALWPRHHRVVRANFERVQPGMTVAEVEAILGPPGDYRTGPGESDYGSETGAIWEADSQWHDAVGTDWKPWLSVFGNFEPSGESAAYWIGDSLDIQVVMDRSGHVYDKQASDRRQTRGPLGCLLWRVERQWRRWFS